MSYIWYFIGLTVALYTYAGGGGSGDTVDCYTTIGPGSWVPCPATDFPDES